MEGCLNWVAQSIIHNLILYSRKLTLLTQDNARLLEKLKSGFQRTINLDK